MIYQLKHKALFYPWYHKSKTKKLININISSDSSSSETDPEFEKVFVKRKPKQQYISNQGGGRIVTMKLYQTNQNQKKL